MPLMVACAYRSVSSPALQVITGTIPLDLAIMERLTWLDNFMLDGIVDKMGIRDNILVAWQDRWDNEGVAAWIRQLIPVIKPWFGCRHRSVDYWISQASTGHGSFGTYTKRIGKIQGYGCRYCDLQNSPDHTLFNCPKWNKEKRKLNTLWDTEINAFKFIEGLLRSSQGWDQRASFLREVMGRKE